MAAIVHPQKLLDGIFISFRFGSLIMCSCLEKICRGKPVSSDQKIMIHNIYAKFREQNEALSKTEMVKRVSEAAGIGLTLV
jgi:hypothetical protein